MKITKVLASVSFMENEFQACPVRSRYKRYLRIAVRHLEAQLVKAGITAEDRVQIVSQAWWSPFGSPTADWYRTIDVKL